jgi:hypothetical protein
MFAFVLTVIVTAVTFGTACAVTFVLDLCGALSTVIGACLITLVLVVSIKVMTKILMIAHKVYGLFN